ncbi:MULTISPECIES: caspase family protein [unclassified Pseudomonas]|uniref:caspase family protein n=1 Tax=unclassified Pseudomonas TaxID=196821 RepID=UPI002AC8F0B2|nr:MULTISPECIES: caspase family protein [unclassified Pseudomonas]MEB0048263.1 caspase family protein [Pseudomonas sp. Dout3]MEB0099206.1 caspase family protein [Pseudomonas sp. DC1.2]WPX61518.1 caspase family protein [Pseudomonas sp. DC1.2]
MGARVLLCIGCDDYQSLNKLSGAERDALSMHTALSSGPLSRISQEDSYLLKSPSRSQLDEMLLGLQDRYDEIESFTLFFAGHGGEANDSYFFCLSDTRADRLSTTGFALSRLFEYFNELKAAHCNVIIDACNAGGMVSNLGILLKPEVIGKAKTFGVSFFVSSAADQYASENSLGGFGTVALLKVLHGEIDTGSRAAVLDLLDIGRPAAQHVSDQTGGEQMPSVWSVNLYGHMPLSGNPHASDNSVSSLLTITGISPASPAGQAISSHSSELYKLMFAPEHELSAENLFPVLSKFVHRLVDIPNASGAFIGGVWQSLEKGARHHSNLFARVELSATCISLLLESSQKDSASGDCVIGLAHEIVVEIEYLLSEIVSGLREDPCSLSRHGIPDLFYLPQRISRILGWAGASLHLARELGRSDTVILEALQEMSGYLMEHYASVLAGMSEDEAPFWAAFLTAIKIDELNGLGELVVSKLINVLIEHDGRLARPLLPAKDVFAYLKARADKDSVALKSLSSSPSETLALVLLISERHSLRDELDFNLVSLDHAHLNIFIPQSYLEFSQPFVRNGINHVFQIGHKVWTVEDVTQRWEAACKPQMLQDASLQNLATRIGAICASLIFPNRVPWFLVSAP